MLVVIIISITLLLTTFYSPIFSYIVASAFFLIISFFRKSETLSKLIFLSSSLFLVIVIANINNSFHLFYHAGHDFSSYYNNFLRILDREPLIDWFNYGGGVEVLLPLVNYLISFIVTDYHPYPVYYLHSIFQNILLCFLVLIIKKNQNLSWSDSVILLLFMFIFYRFFAGMNALRQGYASFFILFAYFSSFKREKILFLLIASLFHITSIALYFFIININRIRSDNLIRVLFIILIGSGVAFFVSYISFFFNISIIKQKLIFLIMHTNADIIKESVINGVKVGGIFSFLILFSLLSKRKDDSAKFTVIFVMVLIASIHPSIFRVLFPIVNVLMGYYFFNVIRFKKKVYVFLFVFLISVANNILLIRNDRYNYSFDVITTPREMFENFQQVVNRFERESL